MSTIELRGSSFNHSSTAFWVALCDRTESGVHTDPIYTWDEGVSARSHVFEPGDSLRQLQVKYVYALCHFSSCSSTPFAIVPRLFVIIAGIKQFKTSGQYFDWQSISKTPLAFQKIAIAALPVEGWSNPFWNEVNRSQLIVHLIIWFLDRSDYPRSSPVTIISIKLSVS